MISRKRWSHAGLSGCRSLSPPAKSLGRVHHGRLPGLPLLGRHRLAVHDPLHHRRRRGRQRRHRRTVRQPTGSHHQDPLVQCGQIGADGGAQRPATMQRPQRHGDRVDEDRYHRARGGVTEELLQRLDGAVVDVHARPISRCRRLRRERLSRSRPPVASGTSSGPAWVP